MNLNLTIGFFFDKATKGTFFCFGRGKMDLWPELSSDDFFFRKTLDLELRQGAKSFNTQFYLLVVYVLLF